MLLLLAASLYPAPPQWTPVHLGDRVVHFLAYLPLGVLLNASLNAGGASRTVWRHCAVALLLGAGYGVALEVMQQFTGRMPEVGDALFNLLGAAAGAVAVAVSRLLRRAG